MNGEGILGWDSLRRCGGEGVSLDTFGVGRGIKTYPCGGGIVGRLIHRSKFEDEELGRWKAVVSVAGLD